jgi:SAM-dependent methyltransferase
MTTCNICGGPTTSIEVKEQMMGLKEKFTYNQCSVCGHTHLEPVPADMGKYYDTKEYYSFKTNHSFAASGEKNIKLTLKKILLRLGAKKSFLFSSALKAVLSVKGISQQSNILDYGCGAGQFVEELNSLGFIHTKGYDPFLPQDVSNNGELYLTSNLAALKIKQWDIITLNHVFEHLQDPVPVLQNLRGLLQEKGKLILRFPIIDSFAFEKYRENWVQLDAPLHLNLFTRKSIRTAVEKAGGFGIVSMYDDSFHFQFTGSELYLKDLSLNPENNNRKKRFLSLSTYRYHFLAKKLNKQNKGDQMTIILERN